jgi:hypothetical protein
MYGVAIQRPSSDHVLLRFTNYACIRLPLCLWLSVRRIPKTIGVPSVRTALKKRQWSV